MHLPAHVHVADYVRRVEETLARLCVDFVLHAARIPGCGGVWVPADELYPEWPVAASGSAPLGTMHGFALNCDVDLS